MPNYKLHNDLKQLSEYIYKSKESKLPENYKYVTGFENTNNGFYSEIYEKDNQLVIVFKGTDINDGVNDLKDDLKMLFGLLPSQMESARIVYDKLKSNCPNKKILLTGHSLGGSLAQGLGFETNSEAVTFGAYGLRNIYNYKYKNNENIINYGNSKDAIFTYNINNQIGKTYIIFDNNESNSFIKDKRDNYNIIDKHFISNMGDIKKSKEYKKLDYFPNKNLVLKGAISKTSNELSQPLYTREMIDKMTADEYLQNEPMIMEQLKTQGGIPNEKQLNQQNYLSGFINQISGNSNIFTREDIKNMSADEYLKNEKAIDFQLKTIGIPSQVQANQAVQSGGMIYVQPYTRADGTGVRGYYRAR